MALTTLNLAVLPVVAGLDAPTDLPVCPALRGEPCRPFVP